jgi:effector-binding domain-containing protein
MEYQVHVQHVESQLTGVVHFRASPNELATVVPAACGEVWTFFRTSGLPRPGRHLALYLDDKGNLEVGVEVTEPFAGNERVVCSSLPAGTVATATHWGPYQRLGEAHKAICKWCSENGHTLTGVCWELYGHWTDNLAQVRTDVYYLLQDAGGTPAPQSGS